MNPDMEWADELFWIDVPIGEDGHEAVPGGEISTAYVGWRAVDGDRLIPAAMTLRNMDLSNPIDAQQWRRLKPAEAIAATRDLLEAGGLLLALSADGEHRAASERIRDGLSHDQFRIPRDGSFYAEVGAVYMDAVRKSDTQPVQAVRLHFKRKYPTQFKDLRDSKVRGWVRTAKDKGYITRTVRPSRRKATDGGT